MEIQQTWPLFAIACNTTQPAIRFGFGSPAFSVWVVGRQAGRGRRKRRYRMCALWQITPATAYVISFWGKASRNSDNQINRTKSSAIIIIINIYHMTSNLNGCATRTLSCLTTRFQRWVNFAATLSEDFPSRGEIAKSCGQPNCFS